MYFEKIVDTVNGEEYIKPLADEEIKKIEENIIDAQEIIKQSQKDAAGRAAVLDKLGITEEEAKLLLS